MFKKPDSESCRGIIYITDTQNHGDILTGCRPSQLLAGLKMPWSRCCFRWHSWNCLNRRRMNARLKTPHNKDGHFFHPSDPCPFGLILPSQRRFFFNICDGHKFLLISDLARNLRHNLILNGTCART